MGKKKFKKTVDDIKRDLLKPAFTSKFMVEIDIPKSLRQSGRMDRFLTDGLRTQKGSKDIREHLSIACADASLPGSSLMTFDVTDDRHGVTEVMAHRRQYDQKMDFTFYVGSRDYMAIRFFEGWMDYVVDTDKSTQQISASPWSPNHHYRMNFPNADQNGKTGYKLDQGLKVSAFENQLPDNEWGDENDSTVLEYNFLYSFPVAVAAMPVSYSGTDLLRCTVTMSYLRYVIG